MKKALIGSGMVLVSLLCGCGILRNGSQPEIRPQSLVDQPAYSSVSSEDVNQPAYGNVSSGNVDQPAYSSVSSSVSSGASPKGIVEYPFPCPPLQKCEPPPGCSDCPPEDKGSVWDDLRDRRFPVPKCPTCPGGVLGGSYPGGGFGGGFGGGLGR